MVRNRNFNEDWKFYLGELEEAYAINADETSWETVSIPHDFSIIQAFTTEGTTEAESGFLPGGIGWYRKSFIVDVGEAEKNFVISFDGAYQHTYVYVNSTYVGENHYGYNPFDFDITKYLICDGITENVIAVKVVHELPSSRYYSGSGIYRDVTLVVTNPVHIALNGIYVTTPNLQAEKDGDVAVHIKTEILNNGKGAQEILAYHTIFDEHGTVVSEIVTAKTIMLAGEGNILSAILTVPKPLLWSSETPILYQVQTEVLVKDEVVDVCYTDFGFRYFQFDADKGFYLNDQAVKIKGVCLHHDQGALGAAAYEDALARQLRILKDMGCNGVRTSHNIAAESFIRLCNRMGLLVMEEAFDGWSAFKGRNNHDFSEYFNEKIDQQTWAEFVLKSMIKRDRNAPSVILWDIGNEILNTKGDTSKYVSYAKNMIEWIHQLDRTRPITHGDNKGVVTKESTHKTAQIDRILAQNNGVVGFNYWAENLPIIHSHYPEWKLISTETVSSLNSRGAYDLYTENPKADRAVEGPYICSAYDICYVSWGCSSHEGWYNNITNDCNAGEFIWTGFDYIGEPNPWWSEVPGAVTALGAAPNSAYFGVLDTAGFPKDRYYFYRSQWNQKNTTLHLVTAWDQNNQYLVNGKTPVWIYSNVPKVELYKEDSKGHVIKLATATRTEQVTAAGHRYGFYISVVEAGAEEVCSLIQTAGSEAFSARFFVTYEVGAVYAVAYDQNGNVIQNTIGNNRVNTPEEPARIIACADKTEIKADGKSLCYITVDVTDQYGNLDTTADNKLKISLKGVGEIIGVDNGNPATTEKYQQKSVLTSPTTANIRAYVGKALVIVRSKKEAGEVIVTVEGEGLEGVMVKIMSSYENNESLF